MLLGFQLGRLADSGAVHTEAGVGWRRAGTGVSDWCSCRCLGTVHVCVSHGPAAGSGAACTWKDRESRPLSRGTALRKGRAGD